MCGPGPLGSRRGSDSRIVGGPTRNPRPRRQRPAGVGARRPGSPGHVPELGPSSPPNGANRRLWIAPQTRTFVASICPHSPCSSPGRLLGSPPRPSQRPRFGELPRRASPAPAGRPSSRSRGASGLSRPFSTLVDGPVDNTELASTTVVSSLAADLWDSGSAALRAAGRKDLEHLVPRGSAGPVRR